MQSKLRFAGFALAFMAVAAAVAAVIDPSIGAYVLAHLTHPDAVAGGLVLAEGAVVLDAAKVKEALDKLTGQVKEVGEKALAEAAKGITMSEAQKAKTDELLTQMNALNAQFTELEQKAARRGEQPQAEKSMGRKFVDSDDFKAFAGKAMPRGRIDLQEKATITLAVTDADGSAGDTVQNTRVPGILSLPQRRMTVRDLITPGRMDGNTLEYVKETGWTSAAATVAEGAAKPQSNIKFDLVSTTAKVIAHYVKASRQILSDSSQLASIIDNRLRYGLAYAEEQQLLNGPGTGTTMLGIIPQATAFSAPFDPAGTETNIDNIRLAMLQASLAEYPASGTVMHPSDWARIELLKDTTGQYIIGNPQGTLSPTLWGLPVVATQAITIDKFLVGAFKMGAQVFDRWLARVEVATENEDDFIKNLVTILAEERLALAVYRPEAFIYGDFGLVA